MNFQILESDIEFTNSPDSQTPECICSRCSKVMLSQSIFRIFTPTNTEYRLCHGLRLGRDCNDEENFKEEEYDLKVLGI